MESSKIRFRAWDKKKNNWFDDDSGELYIELNGNINFGWNGEVMDDYTDRVTLMQYTGKKDADGVKIYEGDIVHDGEFIYTVCFGDFLDDDVFQEQDPRQTGFYVFNTHTDETFPFYSLTYRVIGNIYQNKQLLED